MKQVIGYWPRMGVIVAFAFVLGTTTSGPLPLGMDRLPGVVRTFYLFATDGFLPTASGSPLHFYGLIGGLENAPLVYRNERGGLETIPSGPPVPTAGPVTASEAAFIGHAQWPAPPLWAAAGDLIEIRFKNLGASQADVPLDPIGLELRGLNETGQDTATPETARLAVPFQPGDPESGNVVVYLLSPSRPGTFAYGAMGAMASMGSMSGMGNMSGTSSPGSMKSAGSPGSMNGMGGCMCGMMRSLMGMGTMNNMGSSMNMTGTQTVNSPTSMSRADGAIEMAVDGALVVYQPGDPAAHRGPGSGAEGELAGQPFDQDWLMLLPQLSSPTNDTVSQPQSPPLSLERVPSGRRVLLRMLNLGMAAQSISLQSPRYIVLAYRRNPLEWSIPRVDAPRWLSPSDLEWQPGQAVSIEAGEAYDWLIEIK